MEYVDVAIGNEEDAEKCLGIAAEGVDVTTGEIDANAYESVVKNLVSKYGFKKVAITLRESHSADDNDWSAIYFDGADILIGKKLIRKHQKSGQNIGVGYPRSKNSLFRELNRSVEWIFSNDAVGLNRIFQTELKKVQSIKNS